MFRSWLRRLLRTSKEADSWRGEFLGQLISALPYRRREFLEATANRLRGIVI
jgi:hypothetical protein